MDSESARVDLEEMAAAKGLYCVKTIWVHHWSEKHFSFRVERPAGLRFRSGEFVMIGLADPTGRPLMRAYSLASPSWEDHLEFFSVKVPNGALTSRLQHLAVGDTILLSKKPTGTLVIDALKPGKYLVMIGTGTGLAPFLSILRDPDTHDKFDQIVITHTVAREEELAYRDFLEREIRDDVIFGEALRKRFTYYPTVTRGPFRRQGRITTLIRDDILRTDLGLAHEDSVEARVMVCGSLAFNKDMIDILESFGLVEGSNSSPQDYVIEKAFVG